MAGAGRGLGVDALGRGRQPLVHVALGEHRYRSKVAVPDVAGAKTEATRQRRIEKHVTGLALDQRDDQ